MPYNLASYQSDQGPRSALIVDHLLYDLEALSGRSDFSSILSVLQNWNENREMLAALAEAVDTEAGVQLASVTLLAPVLNPPAVFCAGANFPDHVEKMANAFGLPVPESPKAIGVAPFHFLKVSRCCVGTGQGVKALGASFDYEIELAAVIGRPARNVDAADALDYVAGYAVSNDLSARDLGFRNKLPRDSIFYHSWLAHKSFEDSAPIGPWITPKEQLPHWSELRLQTRVNGELRQDGLCGTMYHSIEEQIAELSKIITLQPGDVILTGTPGGVGAESGQFLKPGDTVEVSVDGIGAVVTPIL